MSSSCFGLCYLLIPVVLAIYSPAWVLVLVSGPYQSSTNPATTSHRMKTKIFDTLTDWTHVLGTSISDSRYNREPKLVSIVSSVKSVPSASSSSFLRRRPVQVRFPPLLPGWESSLPQVDAKCPLRHGLLTVLSKPCLQSLVK
jgi:hypothetical protein